MTRNQLRLELETLRTRIEALLSTTDETQSCPDPLLHHCFTLHPQEVGRVLSLSDILCGWLVELERETKAATTTISPDERGN